MTPTAPPASTRPLWLAVFVLAATVTGTAAGILAFAGGTNIPLSVVAGGTAFGGSLALLLALAHFMRAAGN
ncbi:hypothetical protein [Actinoplanes xinjiangensis]|uniref:Uncharacterized protein n=1 Tax=Actinoplanes xinjiangensis TaxID=512350 RepID=A0A316FC16_9ACTN|nr:hypothetical protein [Actinoplanes xinjiangensis]PWK45323.1 hypothetical protein BC793_111297 [Actinoplanes xinjiangensis]GIF41342.1 hypothetical protein Axi01nite_56530 [Actinoplanes xinjiangensis]